MTGLLEIQGLTKRFGRTEVLRGISLSVPRGAIYGFVGRNGAGKTTTIECALGLLRADSGEIRLLGRPPREICRSGGRIGIALDVPGLHPHLTVREELEHAALFTGREGRTPAQVLALAGIGEFASRKTRKLSLGNRRRAAIALAILGRPELIVLDEPFSGLDPPGVEDLLSLFVRLGRAGPRSSSRATSWSSWSGSPPTLGSSTRAGWCGRDRSARSWPAPLPASGSGWTPPRGP